VDPAVAGLLTAGRLRWVAPSEPREELALDDLRLVGVDPATLEPEMLLSAQSGLLAPPPQLVEKITDPPGAFPVLRATRRQYVLVGGIPAPQSLQILDLTTGITHWAPLSGSLPTDVAAATADATRERLWVVDSVPSGHGRGTDRRLLVVDVESGIGAELARRPGAPPQRSFVLAAAPGGSFVLAVSNEPARRHTLYWLGLDASGRLAVEGTASGPGIVLGQMTAGERGVSVAVSDRHGSGFQVSGTRWSDFRPAGPRAIREML